MTENASRQPKGIPAGGQFAATAHAETDLSLTPRRAELNGWPKSLPEPEVSFHFGDDGVITTNVDINGEPAFEVWNPGDDVHSIETTQFDLPELADSDNFEAAESWAKAKHEQIADDLRAEMHAAVERSRARVLAKVTGAAPQLSDDQLEETIDSNDRARDHATRDVELASTALLARKILEAHPGAAYAQIHTSAWENERFIDGAVIKDASLAQLHDIQDEGEDTEPGACDIVDLLKNLAPEPRGAYWSDAFSAGTYGDDLHMIDLKKAAAWTPGASA